MIELKLIDKSYGNQKILDKISLNIKKGEFISIVGPSGAGKTTLLNIIGTIEDFDKSEDKYMMFFEDDMLLDFSGFCSFGFKKQVKNLLKTIVSIMDKENYDFLKMSFTEFYGDNSEQWSWHNLPADKKIQYFGDIKRRPQTLFRSIKQNNKTPYAEGEIYYCNWPHIISKEGNKKMKTSEYLKGNKLEIGSNIGKDL